MFVKAIQEVSQFTRPIHTISRTYKGLISPGAATFFFVNENGVAITCRHVAQMLMQADQMNVNYRSFQNEVKLLPRDNKYNGKLKGLQLKYMYKPETVVQMKANFINSVSPFGSIRFVLHPTLDLSIMIFEGFTAKAYTSHAVFVKDINKVQQGKSLCRLGFPFPEFTNFTYNKTTDDIEWSSTGNTQSPQFPIDGIITRFVGIPGSTNPPQVGAIELSTPGLRGQSGGPLFDVDGLIYGVQSATSHLHLGFDIKDKEIITSDGKQTKVSHYPFLNTGICVHVDRIKEFLSQNQIHFYEA